MSTQKFRHPSEMPKDEERTPVSARVKLDTKAVLEKAAKENGLSLALLMAHVLEDYASWLKEQGKSESRRK